MSTNRAADRCPGVLRLHAAADGYLARIRIPGGRMTAKRWTALAAAATLGDGQLHITSRGNLQIRGLADDAGTHLNSLLEPVGLAPSPSHDRMRNILASPLAGRLAGHANLDEILPAVLAELCTRPGLSDEHLSGKFLLGLDDGSGDVLREHPDLGACLDDAGGQAEVIIGGVPSGWQCTPAALPRLLADLAEVFLTLPEHDWRISGDKTAIDAVTAAASQHPLVQPRNDDEVSARGTHAVAKLSYSPTPRLGWIDAIDSTVTLLAVTALAIIDARLAEFLGAIDADSTISTDRVIGIHGLTDNQAEQVVRVLAPMGLIFDVDSPWTQATACIGAPACASALAPVHADLMTAVRQGDMRDRAQHWVGCDRACGWDHRAELHRATGEGYTVIAPDGPAVAVSQNDGTAARPHTQ